MASHPSTFHPPLFPSTLKRLRSGIIYPKRFVLLLSLLIGLVLLFWLGSRYPALLHKADIAADFTASSFLTNSPLFETEASQAWWLRLWYGTLNWLNSNRIGMGFGLLLATFLLPLMQTVKLPQSTNRWLNTMTGMTVGVPLGVCVNCATPVAAGMLKSGGKAHTALATLLTSPSLNVLVLVMLVSLYSPIMIALKVGSVFLMIWGILPWLLDRFPVNTTPDTENLISCSIYSQDNEMSCSLPSTETSERWLQAISKTIRSLVHVAFWLLKNVVPWMILAGFLGALVTEVLPVEQLLNQAASPIGLFLVSLASTFIPVPIGFDVMLPQALMKTGLHPAVGMSLLSTLGLFSIFPCLILGRETSWKLALSLFMSVVCLGLFTGLVVLFLN